MPPRPQPEFGTSCLCSTHNRFVKAGPREGILIHTSGNQEAVCSASGSRSSSSGRPSGLRCLPSWPHWRERGLAMEAEMIQRPDGKHYRPRKLAAYAVTDDDDMLCITGPCAPDVCQVCHESPYYSERHECVRIETHEGRPSFPVR